MNFTHLQYAVTVAKTGSISRAAQQLFVAQPYLSNTIKKLEEEIGCQIFERTRNGIRLTPEGQEFISSSYKILAELNNIKNISSTHFESPLQIATYYSSFLLHYFLEFKSLSPVSFPDCIEEMGICDVFHSILSGKSTLGFIFYVTSKESSYFQMGQDYRCVCQNFFTPMKMHVLLSKTHPLASKSSIHLEDLHRYPYVAYNDTASTKYLKLLGMEEHPGLLQVSDRGSFYDAIEHFGYLSTAPISEVALHSDCKIIPLADLELYLNICYVTSNDYQLNCRECAFLDFIRKKLETPYNNLN